MFINKNQKFLPKQFQLLLLYSLKTSLSCFLIEPTTSQNIKNAQQWGKMFWIFLKLFKTLTICGEIFHACKIF